MKTVIKFSREHKEVIIPSKHKADAGMDLYLDSKWLKDIHGGVLRIKPNQTVLIPTGLRSIMEVNYYAQIQERGSTGVKGMKYGAGVIDSSFLGVWNVVLTNCNTKDIVIYDSSIGEIDNDNIYYFSKKAIAQFVLLPVPEVKIEEVSVEDVLSEESHRGEGKLGSSGK